MNRKTGFTLIELLAVVLIIAILTAVALPQYRRAIQRTQATEALMNLRTMFDSAMRYRAANSENPKNASNLDVNFFEAQHSGDHSDIGFFRYTFNTAGIKACLLEGSNTETFCLWMNYKKAKACAIGAEYGPGTIFCQPYKIVSKKYAYVCTYLGTPVAGCSGQYIIE